METRDQSNFVLVLACIGVVVFHLIGDDMFYIGNAGRMSLENLKLFYSSNGFLKTLSSCFQGSTAVIGIFLINSGYGLYKTSIHQSPVGFYKKRFTKVWIYCLLCGLLCTIILFPLKGIFSYSYIYDLIPVFGFYEMPRGYFVMQYWYLSIIFVCYLLFPFIKKIINNKFFIISALFSVLIGYFVIYDIYTSTSIYHSTLCRLSEFCFGILLAKNQKLEKYIFGHKFNKIFIAFAITMIGYFMLYIKVFTPYAYLFHSLGAYFFGVQVATFLVSNESVASAFSKLKGGTMSVYLLHLVSINFMVSFSNKQIVSYFAIENYYFLNLTLIFILLNKNIIN